MTTLTGKTVLITGANRGLGQALVDVALARGAARIYAAARGPLTHADPRVRTLQFDLTDPASIDEALDAVDRLDVLINNAGLSLVDDLSDSVAVARHLEVNLYGPYRTIRACLPLLSAAGGAIVNVLSLAALAPVPITPAYSISKAAALSMSQSLRALLRGQGIGVHVALPGPIDTDMIRGWDIPKTPAADVARAILDGVANGEEEIFPDPMSAAVAVAWRDGVTKALEVSNAAAVQAMAAQS